MDEVVEEVAVEEEGGYVPLDEKEKRELDMRALRVLVLTGVFGAVAVYDERPYPGSATALEETTCVLIPRSDLFALLQKHPSLVKGLLKSLTRRLLELTERRDLISFSIGLPAPELMPLDTIGQLTDTILREAGPAPFLHCPTEGHTPLRETLARWLASRGIHTGASEVLIVSGSQQGLDLVARVFLDPGDTVVVP